MRHSLCLCYCLVFYYLTFAQNHPPKRFKLPGTLQEVSGLCYAAPDSLWWHNDSGNAPTLLLGDSQGKILREVSLPVPNRDWEDLAADPTGNLYIGDFGNNANRRQDLRVYIFQPATGALDSILFDYPDQTEFPPPAAQHNFDMEGFFWHGDSLHLFSKNRLLAGNYYTKHYVLPAQPGRYTALLRDSLLLPRRVVTAAAISPDGQTVALLSYFFRLQLGFIPKTRTTLWLFTNFPEQHFLRGNLRKQKVRKCPVPAQFEAVDFIDNQSVYIASERTPLYRQQARHVRLKGISRSIRP